MPAEGLEEREISTKGAVIGKNMEWGGGKGVNPSPAPYPHRPL